MIYNAAPFRHTWAYRVLNVGGVFYLLYLGLYLQAFLSGAVGSLSLAAILGSCAFVLASLLLFSFPWFFSAGASLVLERLCAKRGWFSAAGGALPWSLRLAFLILPLAIQVGVAVWAVESLVRSLEGL